MAWFDGLPELSVEHGGAQVSLKEHPYVKESPDMGHFVNKALADHREVGSRIPVRVEQQRNADGTFGPKADAVVNWRKEHLPKIYQAGILEAPPADPSGYGIKKPDSLPEGVLWNDTIAQEFSVTLHKHGIPKSAVEDLLALHTKALGIGHAALKTDYDATLTSLKQEFGDKFDTLSEEAKRLTKAIFKTDEEVAFFEETGLANHPRFLGVLMRLAPLAAQDSSILPKGGAEGAGGAQGQDAVRAEVGDIMANPNNPKYKLYWARDAATLQYIEDLYKRQYGTGQVTIS